MSVPPTLLCTVTFPANTGFAWDFIERLYARMADRLQHKGIRTIVAYPEIAEAPRSLAGGAAVPVVLDTRLETWSALINTIKFIRRENVQVIYFTDRPLWNIWYPILRLAGVRKIVVHDHSSGVRTVPKGIRRVIKKTAVNLPGAAADLVVAVSDYVAKRDRAVTFLPPQKIRRIWNGLDPIPISSEGDLPDIRSLLNVSSDTIVIAAACRATPEKGVHVLFNAFSRLSPALAASCVLAYIGTGPEFDKLSALRNSLAVSDRILMLGYRPGAASLLRTANLCVVPSVWEDAFPLAVLEMMARGRAIVATRVGGVPEMIEDGVSGLLVPPDDVDALAAALERVALAPQLQDSLGQSARERTLRLFSAEQQIVEMLSTFQDAFSK